MVREKKLTERASRQYGKLPYHNWQHALGAMRRGMEIAKQCIKEGIPVNLNVVKWALLFHDAGYHENHIQKGFKTKEDYSIFIAQREMKRMGFSPRLIHEVSRAIASTHRDAPFNTVEAKVVRAADLAGLAAPYEVFIRNTRNLKREYEMMHRKKVPWEEWKKQARIIIEFYLKQDIHLTTKYENSRGESIFHQRTRENVRKMMRETR
jgi:predicted metal-dependent HD superfamily phosphohydrolase